MTQITPNPEKAEQYRPRGLRIGHVHLKVADLERSLGFWRDVIGLQVTQRIPQAVFLSADGYHHHSASTIILAASGCGRSRFVPSRNCRRA